MPVSVSARHQPPYGGAPMDNLSENLLEYISNHNNLAIGAFFEAHYAIDIALALQTLDDQDLEGFCRLVGNEQLARVLEEGSLMLRKRIVDLIDAERIVSVFTYMSSDDIADIVGEMPLDQRKKLLRMMRSSDSQTIENLLGYGPDTAGGNMTTEYIALRNSLKISEALNKIKMIGPKTEVIEVLFVVNDANELIGTADLRDILTTTGDAELDQITDKNLIAVYPETDQEEVSQLVSKYDLKAIPVINHRNAILGIITVDDIIDIIVEEYTEDFLMVSGVSKDETIHSTLPESIRRRLPWLYVNLAAVLLASFTVALFEDVIAQVVALAVAMPIVAGLGGNAGFQTLSVVIRSIALGEVSLHNGWHLVIKELGLGLIHGLSVGIVAGVILYLKYGNVYLGLIIVAAMVGNLIIAGLFGYLVPLILRQLNIDPAVASSIFVTTATDVFGFFAFLGLARLFLPYLL